MAYHVKSDRVIMFGGMFASEEVNDRHVWAYDVNSNTWEQMGEAEGVPFTEVKMAYDAESDLIVLYGGSAYRGRGGDATFVYDFAEDTWTKMSPENNPGKLTDFVMTYVDALDRVVIYGGKLDGDFNSRLAEPWFYDYNSDSWSPLSESQ